MWVGERVKDSRGKDLHSRVSPPMGAAKSRSEGARHDEQLRTLPLAWRCRIAVRVVQRVAARRCLARTTTTTRMRNSTTAGPAESPCTRYPLPPLPTSWDCVHVHRKLPTDAGLFTCQLAIPERPYSIVRHEHRRLIYRLQGFYRSLYHSALRGFSSSQCF